MSSKTKNECRKRASKRRWLRWIDVRGQADLTRLAWLARREGMMCIDGVNIPMSMWIVIALWGTSEQMQSAEQAWMAAGHHVTNRRPKCTHNAVSSDLPRKAWVEHELPPVGKSPQGKLNKKRKVR